MAVAPDDFGQFSGALLVGNFGDGRINAFDSATGAFLGQLANPAGQTIEIEGLWGLVFGKADEEALASTLFFAAGINDEADGLFGTLKPAETDSPGDHDPIGSGRAGIAQEMAPFAASILPLAEAPRLAVRCPAGAPAHSTSGIGDQITPKPTSALIDAASFRTVSKEVIDQAFGYSKASPNVEMFANEFLDALAI
jgi:hypothetical protein